MAPRAPRLVRQLDVPAKLSLFFDPPLGRLRYRVAYGGRGGMKSWTVARRLLLAGMERPLRVLCCREFQTSIRESVLFLLEAQVEAMGLTRFYRVNKTELLGRNGTQFIMAGLRRNVQGIRSMEGIDVAWVEEAQAVSDESWRVLIPTIRRKGSEIWVLFNPDMEGDPTYQRFVVRPPRRSRVVRVGYRDNPWLPDVLRDEAEELRERDPEAYETVWGGEPWRRSKAEVLNGRWVVDLFEPTPAWEGPYYGVDWGFSADPTVAVRVWIHDGTLYVEHEAGGIALDNDATARALLEVPGGSGGRWMADGARPETINEMRLRRLDVLAAPKWEGSVRDGIAHLRTYRQIVIHPRCSRVVKEARLWRYKTDPRTGEPLPKLLDGNDHSWDAIRYALASKIRRGKLFRVGYTGQPETPGA